MTLLPFVKLSGAGNDFILTNGSLRNPAAGPSLAKKLCNRRLSVGADGLLVVSRGARRSLPSVRYYNADGSKAFCGNGTRCAAWWMHLRRWVGKRFVVRTISGPVAGQVTGSEKVRLGMPLPKNVRWNMRLSAAGRTWAVHFLEIGVPHAVVILRSDDLEKFPVAQIGRALRNHPAFRPKGTNVDFIVFPNRRSSNGLLCIRTYERGVEGETLACGTGAVASAFCAHFLYGIPSPIRIATRGGDILTAYFNLTQGGPNQVWLEGPARVTFQGEVVL